MELTALIQWALSSWNWFDASSGQILWFAAAGVVLTGLTVTGLALAPHYQRSRQAKLTR